MNEWERTETARRELTPAMGRLVKALGLEPEVSQLRDDISREEAFRRITRAVEAAADRIEKATKVEVTIDGRPTRLFDLALGGMTGSAAQPEFDLRITHEGLGWRMKVRELRAAMTEGR